MKPKISIIIPVYNGLPFIEKALECAAEQDYPAHEIIVINDGSKDRTQDVLDAWKGRIITKTIPNGGVSNARNEAMRMATGNYLAFLDSDDRWFRNKLKVFAGFIEKYPEAGLFSSDYVERLADFGHRLKTHSSLIGREEKMVYDEPAKVHPLRLLLLNDIGFTPSSVVVKKSAAETAGFFDTNCKLVEDLDFYLRVAMRADFVFIRDILLFKRNHDANMSFNRLRMNHGRKAVIKNFYTTNEAFIHQKGLTECVQRALAHSCYVLGNLYFESGDNKKAFESYSEALRQWPSPQNYVQYAWAVFKKSARRLTGDKVNRKSLEKIIP